MHQRLRIVLGSALVGLLVLAHAPAASAAGYLKIGDIKGESTAKGHEGEIEILSWSFGTSPAGTGPSTAAGRSAAGSDQSAGQPTGKRQHKPITITKSVDKATPMLAQASRSGTILPEVTLYVQERAGATEPYMKIELKNVYITSYQTSGSGDRPTETLSLNYERIKTTPAGQAKAAAEPQ